MSVQIHERQQLVALAKQLKVRPDWHEPDEQEVTVRVKGTPAKRSTLALQRSTNSAIPYSSMSRLLLNPSSFSTSTSTHRPWQSKPF